MYSPNSLSNVSWEIGPVHELSKTESKVPSSRNCLQSLQLTWRVLWTCQARCSVRAATSSFLRRMVEETTVMAAREGNRWRNLTLTCFFSVAISSVSEDWFSTFCTPFCYIVWTNITLMNRGIGSKRALKVTAKFKACTRVIKQRQSVWNSVNKRNGSAFRGNPVEQCLYWYSNWRRNFCIPLN